MKRWWVLCSAYFTIKYKYKTCQSLYLSDFFSVIYKYVNRSGDKWKIIVASLMKLCLRITYWCIHCSHSVDLAHNLSFRRIWKVHTLLCKQQDIRSILVYRRIAYDTINCFNTVNCFICVLNNKDGLKYINFLLSFESNVFVLFHASTYTIHITFLTSTEYV